MSSKSEPNQEETAQILAKLRSSNKVKEFFRKSNYLFIFIYLLDLF